MSELPSAYSNLLERMREVALLTSSAPLLAWDQETYMPRRPVGFRAEQLSYLRGRALETLVAGCMPSFPATEGSHAG
jgi:Zn-dependent M32 family carboxypeptidase